MASTRKIYFRRTKGSNPPTETLLAGELAYLEGSQSLIIGTSAGSTHSLVLDGSIVDVEPEEDPTAINLKRDSQSNSPVFTLDASTVDTSHTLTLPDANPDGDSPIPMLISSDGSIAYDQPTTGAMIEVGDVGIGEDTVYPNEVLMYDSTTEGGKWNHVLATEVKSKMGMGPDYNAEYANVTVNNILEVDGAGAIADIPNITVRDKMISLGLPSVTETRAYTMVDGIMTLENYDGALESGDTIWVNHVTDSSGNSIPAVTGVRVASKGGAPDIEINQLINDSAGRSPDHVDYQATTSYEEVGTPLATLTENPGFIMPTDPNTYGNSYNDDNTYLLMTIESLERLHTVPDARLNITGGDLIADILLVGGGSGRGQYWGTYSGQNVGTGTGGWVKYYKNVVLNEGFHDIQVGEGGYGWVNGYPAPGSPWNTGYYGSGNHLEPSTHGHGERTHIKEQADPSNILEVYGGGNNRWSSGFQGGRGAQFQTGQVNELGQGGSVSGAYLQAYGISSIQSDYAGGGGYIEGLSMIVDSGPDGDPDGIEKVRLDINGLAHQYGGGGGARVNHEWWNVIGPHFGKPFGGIPAEHYHPSQYGGGIPWMEDQRGAPGAIIIRVNVANITAGFMTINSGLGNGVNGSGNITYTTGALTDAGISGGGMLIPGTTQKKLEWVDDTEDKWKFVGGDLRVDSEGTKNTSLYVGSEKVITVDVEKTIVIDATENVEDNEIKEEDAKKLHNYNPNAHGIGSTIQVGRINTDFKIVNATLTGDFDFGDDEDGF